MPTETLTLDQIARKMIEAATGPAPEAVIMWLLEAAVAQRDREWETRLLERRIRESVAQERAALREIADDAPCTCPSDKHDPTRYINCFRGRLLAALDAREAAEPVKTEPPALPLGHEFVAHDQSVGHAACFVGAALCHHSKHHRMDLQGPGPWWCAQTESAHKPAREKEGA